MTPQTAVPDVYFTEAQQSAARRVVHHDLGGVDRIGLAFLGGSLAVGLGHATSDVDLYVVGSGLPPGEVVHDCDGVSVHVAVVRPEYVHQLVGLGSRFVSTGMDRSQILADQRTLGALVRLTTGWRLVCVPEWELTLRGLRRDVVRQVLIARHANVFAASAEDVAGALASGDGYTAASASALALEAAAEAALAAADDIYVGPKFLLRRLDRTAVTRSWAPQVWRLLNEAWTALPAGSDPAGWSPNGQGRCWDGIDQVRRVAERRLRAGNLLLSWCAVEGWERPLARLPEPATDAVTGTRRSPYFAAVRFADGLALMGPEDGYEVDEAVVALWRDDGTWAGDGTAETLRALTSIGALRAEAEPAPGIPPPAPAGPGPRITRAGRFAIHPRAERRPAVSAGIGGATGERHEGCATGERHHDGATGERHLGGATGERPEGGAP